MRKMQSWKDPYFPAFYEGKTESQAYFEYFESILENLAVFDEMDVYGHIDYVVRYGPNKNQHYTYEALVCCGFSISSIAAKDG